MIHTYICIYMPLKRRTTCRGTSTINHNRGTAGGSVECASEERRLDSSSSFFFRCCFRAFPRTLIKSPLSVPWVRTGVR